MAYGYTQAAVFAYVLGQVDELSRSAVINALRSIDTEGLGLALDGVKIKMGSEDPFLAENLQLIQYDSANKYFENVGDVIDFEGKTAELTPEDLING